MTRGLGFWLAMAVHGLVAAELHGSVWINEFHYDNASGDVDEFVEVVVGPDMAGLSLADVTLSLYNGSNGEVYGAHTLDTFSLGDLENGFQFYSLLIPGLQNGADGFALDESGALIEFISYEGSFVATNGPANGQAAADVGVSEATDTLIGSSLGLSGGPGMQASDFTWSLLEQSATPGGVNSGQTLTSNGGPGDPGGDPGPGGGTVPEPCSLFIWAMGLACAVQARRRR